MYMYKKIQLTQKMRGLLRFFAIGHNYIILLRQQLLVMMLWIITTLAMPAALTIFIAAPDLLVLAYGETWLPAALFLRILVAYSAVRPLWENAGAFFIAIGRPKATTRLLISQAALLIALGLPFTLLWGAIGTSIAVSIGFLISILLIYRQVFREIPVQILEVTGVPALASLLTVLIYIVLNRCGVFGDLPLSVRVITKAVYAFVTFAGLVLLLRPRPTLERIRLLRRLITQTP